MRVFFFGAGYCARRLIAREPWIEASGTARSADGVAALRAKGVDAYAFDDKHVDPGLERALKKAEAIVVSIPPRDGARRRARALRRRHQRRGGPAAGPLLFDHRRLWRSRRRLGRRDERDADAHFPWACAARGRGALDGGGPGARGRRGHPASRRNLRARPQRSGQSAPGPGAADRQAGSGLQPGACRRHRRTHASRADPRSWKARSGTSPTTNPPRRRTWSPMRRRSSACRRRPRSHSTKRGFRR